MTDMHQPNGEMLNNSILQQFLVGASKLFIWFVFFAIIYLLRSFFLLIFLTFVFAYIQTRAVNRLKSRVKNRTACVILVAFCFFAVWVLAGTYLVPSIIVQTKIFANNYPTYLNTFDKQLSQLGNKYPRAKNFIPIEWPDVQDSEKTRWSPGASISEKFLREMLGMKTLASNNDSLKPFVETFKRVGVKIVAVVSAFLLALLFSFLIVLDLPRLTTAVLDLRNTKLRFFCTEIAKSIFSFGNTLGRALEAQFFIAVLNTIFTSIGLLILGLQAKMAFLSMIVFICSFIPIIGVFISSVPICLLALQGGGVSLMLFAILFIIIIHMIEAYILSPKIYGRHLHINPVLVLIVLTMAGRLFGIWGLILALPVCRYIFGEAIRF